MRNNKGISLIVLIVTIVVIIILAAVVIIITKSNPIESAKEARFKEDIRTFQYELALAISKNIIAADKKDEKITELDFEKIKGYILSFSEKYRDKIVIQDNELRYTDKIDEKEKEWLESLKIAEKISLLPDGYTELEYIESTGTQYIDTNYTIQNLPITVETSFELTSITPQNLFGTQYGDETSYFVPYITNNNFSFYSFTLEPAYVKKWYDASFVQSSNDLSIMEIKLNDNTYSLKTKITNLPIGSGYQIFSADNRFFAHYKCKYHRLYENNHIVFNFIPALDTTGKPCLYDTVSKKHFIIKVQENFYIKKKNKEIQHC